MRNAGPASLTLLPAEGHPAWAARRDLAFLLGEDAAGLAGRLAPGTAAAMGDLVRGMNCYYSNLIEGHDTRPIDTERALQADFAAEPKRRDLQIEAAAHIAVQAAIDTDAIGATSGRPRWRPRFISSSTSGCRTACGGWRSWEAGGGSRWCRGSGGKGR